MLHLRVAAGLRLNRGSCGVRLHHQLHRLVQLRRLVVLGLLLWRDRELVHHANARMLLWVYHVVHLGRVAIHYTTGIEQVLLGRHVLRPVLLHTSVFVPEL